jgi:hypothetical protein
MRSAAEQEVRDAVVARLRKLRPGARICHEVNSAVYGPNRFDVVAIDKAEIIAVEIKSEKDKLDRAPKQIEAMSQCAHHIIVAMHECHLVEVETNKDAAEYGKLDGKHYLRNLPEVIDKYRCLSAFRALTWVYPERERRAYDWDCGLWKPPAEYHETALPAGALDMLWRDELAALCDSLRISRGKRATMDQMIRALRWHANGKELTLGICRALRNRPFAEADDPINAVRVKQLVEAAE